MVTRFLLFFILTVSREYLHKLVVVPLHICKYVCLFQVITADLETEKKFVLTQEGTQIASNGSHEAVLFNAVPATGIKHTELMVRNSVPHVNKLSNLG